MGTPAGHILRHAAGIVDGARNTQHGHKERSFQCIAEAWEWYLRHRAARYINSPARHPLEGGDVAAMMILLKLARTLYGEPIADHFIDIAGYAGILGELEIDPEALGHLFGEPPDETSAATLRCSPAPGPGFNGA